MKGLIILIFLTIPIYHNIKCRTEGLHYVKLQHSQAVFTLEQSLPAKPLFIKQKLTGLRRNLIGALNANKVHYTWPSRAEEVNIFFKDRVLSVVFCENNDSYIVIYQPGSPLTLKKKAETVGDMIAGMKMYVKHQIAFEDNRRKKAFKELKGGRNA